MRYLTVAELYNACKENKYLLVREGSGYEFGVNGSIAGLAYKRSRKKLKDATRYVSYKPCDINEYIEKKHPFM